MPRSQLYVGDIIPLVPESTTVHVGVPLEEPLQKKRLRRWDPNQPVSPLAESIETRNDTRTSPAATPSLPIPMQVPSPTDSVDIGRSISQSPSHGAGPSSSVSRSSKRKANNALDSSLADFVNRGSDEDSDTDDEHGFMQSSRSERIYYEFFDEVIPPADTIVMDNLQPPVDSNGPPPSTSTAQPSSLASVSLNDTIYGPHSLNDFVWEPLPKPAIPPQQRREPFSASVGPVSTFAAPYDAFVSIWDRSILDLIVAETNRYAEQTLEAALSKGDLGGYSRLLHFKETDADEIYVFFALILATGIVVKSDLSEYWSVNDDVFDTPNFGRYMTYTRFISLAKMLHFVNNDVDISHLSNGQAKIVKIAPIVQHLNEKFQALYQLGQCIALDESLTQWKGSLSINQFIKNKAAAKGVKTYEVCDSSSGYLWRFKIHAGRKEQDNELGYITSLVLELVKGLENKGHTVFMDNFYNSPLLARLLKSRGFDCAGTIRLNRQYVPPDLKSIVKQPLATGSLHGATSGDVDVLVWKDRNIVSLISTYHGAASASRDGKTKPTLVHDYNVRMGGVDKKDQMLSAYPIERKRTAVWYKKLFRRLLNVSVLNSYILHKESPVPEHPHAHCTNHRQFRKNLVKQILAKHGQVRSTVVQPMRSRAKTKFSTEMVNHFPTEFPFNEKLKQRKRGYCGVCRKRTNIQCIGCNIALCLNNCFIKYHT